MASWRRLDSVTDGSWPRWMVTLQFADGYSIPWHRDNLALVDENGLRLWDVSETEPAEMM
jgi:hypothetical protein